MQTKIGQRGIFDREVIEAMSRAHERPVVFALSNPTSRSEATAEEVYGWSEGRAVFASGSPFDPVTVEGKTFVPGTTRVPPRVRNGPLPCVP